MKQLILDSYFMMDKNIKSMVDFINNKMVMDINVNTYEKTTKFGVKKYDIVFTVTTLHMEYGTMDYYFYVENECKFNKDSLIEEITNHLQLTA